MALEEVKSLDIQPQIKLLAPLIHKIRLPADAQAVPFLQGFSH